MPRQYKPKEGTKKRKPIDKEKLKSAVAAVLAGGTLKGNAKKFDVPLMTLKRYARRQQEETEEIDYEPNYRKSQIFSEKEENDLVKYLEISSKLHHGLTPKNVRTMAYQLASKNGKKIADSWKIKEEATYDWFWGFMQRHKELSLRKPEATSLSRATSFNKHNVQTFFGKLKDLMERCNFSPHLIYNVDETGITTVHRPKKVVASRGLKQVSKVTSAERGELITVCSAINAIGNHLPPFIIFPRKNWQNRMIANAPPGTSGAPNPSGWMTAATFLQFLEHFQKHVRSSIENPTLIIFDNHESHISVDSIQYAKDHGIHLLTIPPHTSQKLQPLDRIPFGALKNYYDTACDDWMMSHPGTPITIYDVSGLIGKAYPMAMTPRNIIKSFEITGIYPLNSNIFTDDEFLSSYVTDRPEESLTDVEDVPDNTQEQNVDREFSPFIMETYDHLECLLPNKNTSTTVTNTSTPNKNTSTTVTSTTTSSCLSLANQACAIVSELLTSSSSGHSISCPNLSAKAHENEEPPALSPLVHSQLTPTVHHSPPLANPNPSSDASILSVATPSFIKNATSSPLSTSIYLTPDQIRPYPKAGPRKNTRKGRKKGATKILTDTPEKQAIEQEYLEREEKKRKKIINTAKRNFRREEKKTKPKVKIQRKVNDKSSSDDQNISMPPSPASSDYAVEDDFRDSEEDSEPEEIDDGDNDDIHLGDWVVVNFISEKNLVHRYVGQVIKEHVASLNVKFAKKINEKKFKWPEKVDCSLIGKYQVVKKLPPPKFKSSSRRVGSFEFPKSLRLFKIAK